MVDLDFFQGKIDGEQVLEALGIDIAFRRNDQIMCHCPDWLGNHANGDANPSFGFNEEKLVFNCFVCGGGSLFQLVENMMNCDEDGAIQFLMQQSNLEPQENDQFAAQIEHILNPYEDIVPDPEYPESALFPFRKIHPYLYERGISREVIIDHQVGFDPDHYGIVIPHWFMGVLKGWQIRHLVEEDGVYFCPVESCNHDQKGKVKKVPKYKNTSGLPKDNTLYAYDQTMRYCKENGVGDIIVVESPMTALYLKSHGFGSVMATFGQFSKAQSSLLWPFNRVFFWPDNDKAGMENAARAIENLWTNVILDIVLTVPGDKSDAADLAPDEIQEYLDQAIPAAIWTPKNSKTNTN